MTKQKKNQFFDIKLLKFIFVGILNTIVGTGLQFVFYNLTPLQSNRFGEYIASASSYLLASVMSYFLNKHFTFKNKEKGLRPILKFAINIAVCYVCAYGLAALLSPAFFAIFPAENFSSIADWLFKGDLAILQGNVTMVIGMCLFVAFNYVGQRFFAFKTKEEPENNA